MERLNTACSPENEKMELVILGTGNAMVTRCYNTCFAFRSAAGCYLIDAGGGNGILRQLELVGIPAGDIRGMFITHGHTDHILGAVWVVRKMAELMKKGDYAGPFTIRCHKEAADMLTTFCKMTLTPALFGYIGNGIHIEPIGEGETYTALGMALRPFDILSTKAKQYGFEARLPGGKRLVCLGDEPYNPAADARAEGCDWLLSEAFCRYADRDRFHPYEKHHSTALDAGRMAEGLKAKNLILYHTEDATLDTRKAQYAAEAKEVYSGNVFVPDDLEVIPL